MYLADEQFTNACLNCAWNSFETRTIELNQLYAVNGLLDITRQRGRYLRFHTLGLQFIPFVDGKEDRQNEGVFL